MQQRVVLVFSEKDEEFVDALVGIGTKRNVARVLVYLLGRMEATMRAIEHGTDLSQPQVSTALRYMADQGWVTAEEIRGESKGRPQKQFSLAIPVKEILKMIADAKKSELQNHLTLVKKVRSFVD
jgi:predicted transcriptional regulator